MKTTTTLLLTAALSFCAAPTWAAEELKLAKSQWSSDSKARGLVQAYMSLSKLTLGKLDGYVTKTMEAEVHLEITWDNGCKAVLAKLKAANGSAYKKTYAPEVLTYLAEEQKAWENIRTIGRKMIAIHYKMASTVEEIEIDTKNAGVFFKAWRDRLKTMDNYGYTVNRSFGQFAIEGIKTEVLKRVASKLKLDVKQMGTMGAISARLLHRYQTKAFTFIKKKDLLSKYRVDLEKLKAKNIDPNQSGVFKTHETKWEEVMFKTYQRYIHAVKDWNKAHKFLKGDELEKLVQTFLPKLLAAVAKPLLVGVPNVKGSHKKLAELALDPGKFEALCLSINDVVIKAIDKVYGQEMAKLEAQITSAEEERRNFSVEAQQALTKAEEEAKQRVVNLEIKHEKVMAPLDKELKTLSDALEKADDSAKIRELTPKVVTITNKKELMESAFKRDKLAVYSVWLEARQNEIHAKLKEKVDKVDKRIKEIGEKFPEK